MTTLQHRLGSGFDARSTTEDVLAGIDLTRRTVLVTGGYSGLGVEITRSLTRAGAHVVVPARRPTTAADALRGIPRVEVYELDLADMESIRTFAEAFLRTGRTLDVVIANAAIMAPPRTLVGPGWESQFATNHLGHFALVNRLVPALEPGGSRVVSVSSAGHFLSGIRWDDIHFQAGYEPRVAYGQSKTANALFAVHLDRLGGPSGLHAFSVHPGNILTPLQRHVSPEEKVARGWVTSDGSLPPGFKTPAQGAATAVWAATSPLLDGHGGVYCQDCDVAEPATSDDTQVGGVKPWAVDPDDAARLWELSAELTGVDAFRA